MSRAPNVISLSFRMRRFMSLAVATLGLALMVATSTYARQTRQQQGQTGQNAQNTAQPPVQGQLPPSPDALRAPATLNEENLSKVAAGAEDIVKVLQDDSGMMVELKKWIATNASNHGQIVEEEDLTDDAVIQRVRKDLEFRSVATRLLQRYGYLLPKFNPGSQAELSEQIRRRAEILEFQRAEAERNNPSEREETTQTRGNQQNRGAQFPGAPDAFGTSPSDQLLPNLPLQRSPANGVPLNPNVLRTTSAATDLSGTQDIRNKKK